MATLSLRNVRKRFGPIEVISGVGVEITDGEFIVIVGPSGCGKSTLLRMVAGLESVSEGDIMINDTRVNEKEPMDRDIAMVFQNYALYPHMSVRQNMGYGLKIARTPKDEIEKRVNDAAQLLQLEPYLDRKPKELSGGQRQRVAMGRAIVREPAVFLFDEPLSNLDAKLRVQMRLEIKELQARLGVTTLYVTHDQVEAMTMADRMIVMNGGVAEQIGSPLEVYEKPASVFAAQFIGSPAMNIVGGSAEDGKLVLENGSVLSGDYPNSNNLRVGMRPEHLSLNTNGTIELVPVLAEPLGANTLIHGKLRGTAVPLTASLPGVHTLSSGSDTLQFSVDSDNIHLFDGMSGKRIVI